VRPTFDLNSEEMIANAELLGWLAFPNNPDYGRDLLNKVWLHHGIKKGAIERHELEGLPIVVDRERRLDLRLDKMRFEMRRRMRMAGWFLQAMNQASANMWRQSGFIIPKRAEKFLTFNSRGIHRSFLAASGSMQGEAPNPTYYRQWASSKKILHVAVALGSEEASCKLAKRGLLSLLYHDGWIDAVISASETIAERANKVGIVPLSEAVRFSRNHL
jgi:hypothetical protein